jgi:hypothetical protein
MRLDHRRGVCGNLAGSTIGDAIDGRQAMRAVTGETQTAAA